ncbi:MAG: pyridoxamine 5'-phosphate oxidase family protein [Cyanobacteria bacterium J06632_22]
MVIPGWQQTVSPFHPGEQAIQTKLGSRDRMEALGRRMIRDFLPEQHRQFYAQLSYLLVGTVDATGNPWASILVGQPGFVSATCDRSLHIAAQPPWGDPLASNLAVGARVGVLGIDLNTRRRNRVNGVVSEITAQGFSLSVAQAFGNCPQYIQARQSYPVADVPSAIHRFTGLGQAEQSLVATADTFFIATAYPDAADPADAAATHGVDISHRGGNPGFVRIAGNTLTVPDFSGNGFFNTFGNISLHPRAGLLFVDFEQGHLLYVTGRATIIWDGDPEIADYAVRASPQGASRARITD